MCTFGTAMAAMETAMRQKDNRTLFLIEATLQYVAALGEEADRYGLDLKDYLRLMRDTYIATAALTSREGRA